MPDIDKNYYLDREGIDTLATEVKSKIADAAKTVKQSATSTNADYEVLFSQSANNTTTTEEAGKNSNLKFNPSTGNLQATQLNGVTIGNDPKFTDNNTTYTFANGTNGFTVTPSGGTAQTVTVTPSITNNITGSGTSGYLTKFNGANTITNGPQLGSSTTTYLNNAGSWATPPDTKNTAGSTDTSSKIFLIGATEQSANPQTYSDDQIYATNGTLQANVVNATAGVNCNTANSNSAGGLALYSTNPADYGVMFRGTGNCEKHGYVQSDWATYFTMNSGGTTRGWVFRRNATGGNVASISGVGNAVFNGSVTIGGNTTNTSGCRQVYNSVTQSLDFEFL